MTRLRRRTPWNDRGHTYKYCCQVNNVSSSRCLYTVFTGIRFIAFFIETQQSQKCEEGKRFVRRAMMCHPGSDGIVASSMLRSLSM